MHRRRFMKLFGGSAAALALCPVRSLAGKRPRRWNVILILADDLGWMDSSTYGSRYYDTPNLERLARRGMRFTDAYSANPLCSPTRASILTGKYPARLRITTPACHLPPQPDVPLLAAKGPPWRKMICPRSRRFLPLEEFTLAEAFKAAGYETAFVGKWHLGHEPWWPKKQGFDVNIAGGHYPGPPSYFSPYRIKTLPDGPKGEYLTDRLTDEAVGYLKTPRERPFLLCLWHYAVHAPFQAKAGFIQAARGKVDPRGKQGCPTMAAMIHSLDESVGRVLDTLDERGIADETIVWFASDNGGNMYNRLEGRPPTNNHPLRNGKGSIYEGGTRTPLMVVWPRRVRGGSTCSQVVSSIDVFPTLLEMTGIRPKELPRFDGESIVPVLTGTGRMKRQAIFCHFPHEIPATGNRPSTSVRQGDWKLIRFYGEGPGRSAAHELYNLRDDLGETKNLAAEMPEKVKELDALISRHLAETGALVPVANPAYDPKARQPKPSKPVAGWRPSGDCTLSITGGVLRVTCTGGDPYLHTSAVPRSDGPVTVRLRIRSRTRGAGQVFWTTAKAKPFHRDRRVSFALSHDGEWHEHEVPLPVKGKLRAVRLDVGTAAGRVEIDWVRLCGPDGAVRKRWDF